MSRNLSFDEIEQLIPNISVIRKVGSGVYKTVYQVRLNGNYHALKILDNDVDYNRLYRETEAMRLIDSPFVAKLHQFEVPRNSKGLIPYIIEEFIDGQELKAVIDSGKIYSQSELWNFLNEILQGLEACWSHQIVHRDIKPANIMIRKSGSPVIIDFGLSRHLDLSTLTSTEHSTMGTAVFAPPELLKYTKSAIDGKTDLYSLGITAYMICTGRHPYTDGTKRHPTTIDEMEKFQPLHPHVLNNQISQPLSRFILRLMNRDRVDRFRDAFQAREKLYKLKDK